MDATRFKIYSLLVVKNEADIIVASLTDACRWSDKIIVIDNGSTDGTWERVQSLAQTHPQVIPWLRYEGAFHIGLRAKAFKAFRHEMSSRDWWNVRLDADEFYPGDVRTFLSNVPRRYTTVKKESTDFVLTREDIDQHTFTGDFEQDKPFITHHLPTPRRERRFMRHSALLCWSEHWRYPHPWGRVYDTPIPVEHYQYRSPQQMEQRFTTRRQAKADGCGSFHHEQGNRWQDYILTNRQLEELNLLAHLEEAFQASDKVLYCKRNTIKLIGNDIVVKSFHRPRFPNSLIYGLIRDSKTKRSYTYAQELGDLTPAPLTYREHRKNGLLRDSYYACRLSDLPYTFRQVERDPAFPQREQIIRGIGRLMAQLHAKGFYPLDFTGGNILTNADGSRMQIVDLNRMRRCRHISIKQGLKQARKLIISDSERLLLHDAYIQARQTP
jgi:tRNA A-37 threonylcarbamoyl transferase component Bud32